MTTIGDIAKEANVSKTTVSRVLNNSSLVDDNTRKRITKLIEKYNYMPSTIARNLSKRESSTIGVIIPEIDNPFFGEMLRGIMDTMEQAGLTVMCFNSGDKKEKDEKALAILRQNGIKGLIYTPAVDYSSSEEQGTLKKWLQPLSAPIVVVDRELDFLQNADGVFFDNEVAAYKATEALIKAGHQKIAIINAQLDRVLARERQRGYESALKDYNIMVEDKYIFLGDYTESRAYQLSRQCLDLEERPTAVLTCNNNTTLGFFRAKKEKGISDNEVVCIGFDSIKALDFFDINFNYIERSVYSMGKKAADLLLERIKDPERPRTKYIIEPKLVIKHI